MSILGVDVTILQQIMTWQRQSLVNQLHQVCVVSSSILPGWMELVFMQEKCSARAVQGFIKIMEVIMSSKLSIPDQEVALACHIAWGTPMPPGIELPAAGSALWIKVSNAIQAYETVKMMGEDNEGAAYETLVNMMKKL